MAHPATAPSAGEGSRPHISWPRLTLLASCSSVSNRSTPNVSAKASTGCCCTSCSAVRKPSREYLWQVGTWWAGEAREVDGWDGAACEFAASVAQWWQMMMQVTSPSHPRHTMPAPCHPAYLCCGPGGRYTLGSSVQLRTWMPRRFIDARLARLCLQREP